jgi:hypothetical protein
MGTQSEDRARKDRQQQSGAQKTSTQRAVEESAREAQEMEAQPDAPLRDKQVAKDDGVSGEDIEQGNDPGPGGGQARPLP